MGMADEVEQEHPSRRAAVKWFARSTTSSSIGRGFGAPEPGGRRSASVRQVSGAV